MTNAITPIGFIGKAIVTSLAVPASAVAGTVTGITGGVQPAAISAGSVVAQEVGKGIPSIVYNFFRNTIGNLFAGGLKQITNSGILDDIAKIYGGEGAGKAFSTLFSKLGTSVGGKGLLLLGGQVGLAVGGLVLGAQLAYSAYHKFSEIQKGWRPDKVNSPWIHGTQALFGASTAAAGLMMLFPGTALPGLALLGVGVTGSLGMAGLKYLLGGTHSLRYPNLLPYPLNLVAGAFRNPDFAGYSQ